MRQWHPWSKGESNTSPSSWTSHHDHHLPNSWCPHHTSGSACNLGFLWWWSREAKAQRCRKAESIAKCYPWTAQSLRWPPYWLIVCSARMTQWSCPSSRSAQSAWRKTFLWMRSGKSASRRYCSSWNQSWDGHWQLISCLLHAAWESNLAKLPSSPIISNLLWLTIVSIKAQQHLQETT